MNGIGGVHAALRSADERTRAALRRQQDLELRRRGQAQVAETEAASQARERDLAEGGRPRGFFWGDFDRLSPFSDQWGLERGRPLDRVYIEGFLERNRSDIRGRVLEIEDRVYTERYSDGEVTTSDVLDIDPENPRATWIADLTAADQVPGGSYDCLVFTQVLFLIPDIERALAESWRLLAPGGVLLLTLPTASRLPPEYDLDQDCWRFTGAGARRLMTRHFPGGCFDVTAFGDTWLAMAFLFGLADADVPPADFERTAALCPLVLGVRAHKPVDARGQRGSKAAPPRARGPARAPVPVGDSIAEAVRSADAARFTYEARAAEVVAEIAEAERARQALLERIDLAKQRLAASDPPVAPLDVGSLRWAAERAGSACDPGAMVRWCRQQFLSCPALAGALRDQPGSRWLEIGEASVAAPLGARLGSEGGQLECLDHLAVDDEEAPEMLDQRLAEITEGSYDVIFAWEVLNRAGDLDGAIRSLYRALRCDGLLVLSAVATARAVSSADLWRLVPGGLRRLVEAILPEADVNARGIGNLQTSTLALCGLGPEALSPAGHIYCDPSFPTLSVVTAKIHSGEAAALRRPRKKTGSWPQKPPRVLCYHRVMEAATAPVAELAVAPEKFAEHLDLLAREYAVLGLGTLLEGISKGELTSPNDKPIVCLTFDDCCGDSLEWAAPELVERGFPATFFATSRSWNEHDPAFWWDRLARAATRRGLSEEHVAELSQVLPLLDGFDQERVLAGRGLLGCERLEDLDRVLTPSQLQELDRLPGLEIAAHTRSHLDLRHVPPHRVIDEIASNRIDLELLLGRPVQVLAWPFGACSPQAVEIAQRAGFRFALTVGEAGVAAGVDAMRIPRYEVTTKRAENFADWLAEVGTASAH